MAHLTGINGGIGSGKSVVCRILRTMGYEIYDTDSRAKELMDADSAIKKRIADEICAEAVADGNINRKILADAVFSDEKKLACLNDAVHCAVRADLRQWCLARTGKHLFVECAILRSSGLINQIDDEWLITAPEVLRMKRVCLRSGMTADQVKARMRAQEAEYNIQSHVPLITIINDSHTPLLPAIMKALNLT